MKKISSGLTVFNKKIFPAFWSGLLACVVVATVATGAAQEDMMFLVIPAVMAVFGFIVMKQLVWDLMDEVYDCGDFLLVRNRDEEDKVALSNIMNGNAPTVMNPPRITLRLVVPSKCSAPGGTLRASSPSGVKRISSGSWVAMASAKIATRIKTA